MLLHLIGLVGVDLLGVCDGVTHDDERRACFDRSLWRWRKWCGGFARVEITEVRFVHELPTWSERRYPDPQVRFLLWAIHGVWLPRQVARCLLH